MTNKKLLTIPIILVTLSMLLVFSISMISAEVYQTPGAVVEDNHSESIDNVSQGDEIIDSYVMGSQLKRALLIILGLFLFYGIFKIIIKTKKRKRKETKGKKRWEEVNEICPDCGNVNGKIIKPDQGESQDQGNTKIEQNKMDEEPIDEEVDELMKELGLDEKDKGKNGK